jgi:hypothetical protein
MEISEVFGKAVNLSFKNIYEALKFLKISRTEIEKLILKKKSLFQGKDFDLILDYKPKINQLYLYICPKKASKKTSRSLKPNKIEFKSMVIFLGIINLFSKPTELRLGAIGEDTSDLTRSLIRFKKKF